MDVSGRTRENPNLPKWFSVNYWEDWLSLLGTGPAAGLFPSASPMINLFTQTTRRTEFENSRALVDAFIVFKDTQQYNSVMQLMIGFHTEAALNDT